MQRATFPLPIAEVVAKTAPSDVNPDENEVEKAAETQGRLTYTIETRGFEIRIRGDLRAYGVTPDGVLMYL